MTQQEPVRLLLLGNTAGISNAALHKCCTPHPALCTLSTQDHSAHVILTVYRVSDQVAISRCTMGSLTTPRSVATATAACEAETVCRSMTFVRLTLVLLSAMYDGRSKLGRSMAWFGKPSSTAKMTLLRVADGTPAARHSRRTTNAAHSTSWLRSVADSALTAMLWACHRLWAQLQCCRCASAAEPPTAASACPARHFARAAAIHRIKDAMQSLCSVPGHLMKQLCGTYQ